MLLRRAKMSDTLDDANRMYVQISLLSKKYIIHIIYTSHTYIVLCVGHV